MERFLITVLLVIAMVILPASPKAHAQASVQGEYADEVAGPRKQLATIIFSGLAGAILGLSTLSFYGRPQDKLSNIAVGFAIGIISGTAYTTYKTATRPYGTYTSEYFWQISDGDLYAHHSDVLTRPSLTVNYHWDF